MNDGDRFYRPVGPWEAISLEVESLHATRMAEAPQHPCLHLAAYACENPACLVREVTVRAPLLGKANLPPLRCPACQFRLASTCHLHEQTLVPVAPPDPTPGVRHADPDR